MPLLTIDGAREGAGATASAGRASAACAATREGRCVVCTGAIALSLQQLLRI
jgi:hypothetical protein